MKLPRDGDVELIEKVFDPVTAQQWFDRLADSTDWQQERLRIMGRWVAVPRLTAWYGAHGYRYSGIDHPPRPLTDDLAELLRIAECLAGTTLNSVLANLYRDGRDGMGWHADDEPELGPDPVIVSISFGGTRRFVMKHRHDRALKCECELDNGSCLVMRGTTQRYWLHRIARTTRPVAPRINLTFRTILPSAVRRADQPAS